MNFDIQVPTIVAKYLKAKILYRPAIKSNQRSKHGLEVCYCRPTTDPKNTEIEL